MQLAGGALGWWLEGPWGAAAGAALIAWFLFDERLAGMALAGMALAVWGVYLARK